MHDRFSLIGGQSKLVSPHASAPTPTRDVQPGMSSYRRGSLNWTNLKKSESLNRVTKQALLSVFRLLSQGFMIFPVFSEFPVRPQPDELFKDDPVETATAAFVMTAGRCLAPASI